MDILQYIDKIKQNYGNEPVPVRYNTQKYLRPGFRGAGLVDHGPAGVRQGYGEYKPLNENQLKILKDYKKYSPGDIDITDAKVKSKVRLGTVNKDTIKNLKEHYQWTWEKKDKVRYNNLTKKWEKKVRRIIDGEVP